MSDCWKCAFAMDRTVSCDSNCFESVADELEDDDTPCRLTIDHGGVSALPEKIGMAGASPSAGFLTTLDSSSTSASVSLMGDCETILVLDSDESRDPPRFCLSAGSLPPPGGADAAASE